MDNALVPWFILIPKKATPGESIVEFHCLSKEEQLSLLSEINLISEFVSDEFHPDKINIASIGNIVSQLHVHIVGRYRDDFCWPNVVWGQSKTKKYTTETVEQIRHKIAKHLGHRIKIT
jgi:diadenosine tetraphosphate (Ap4A) HIT family hydrolase